MNILPGDLFLIDSNKTGPKIVKFFMTAPTLYQHIWRKIRGIQEEVKYYHVGMFLNEKEIIEQQWKVQIDSSNKILNTSNRLCIVRSKSSNEQTQKLVTFIAKKDIGLNWDILNAFGKFLTWLTGLKFFARYVQWPKQEICVCRGAKWWKLAFGHTFGAKTHSELTTHAMYKYIINHPEKFDIIYEK